MLMLKTIMSSKMLITNEVLAINKIDDIKGGDKSIKKYGKLLKITKLSKSQKLAKSRKKLSKIGIYLILILKKISQAF